MLIETQDANLIHAIMQQAYAEYRHDASPSSALAETVAGIEQELATGMRAFIWQPDELAIAMVKTQWLPDTLYFSRLSVIPSSRHQGHAKSLLAALATQAQLAQLSHLECKVRAEISRNVALYQGLGFVCVAQESVHKKDGTEVPTLSMRKTLNP